MLEAGFGHGDHFPQYVAFHADSGFLRLNGGPGSDWGTSVVVLPSFWEGGRYHQGGPISVTSQASQSSLMLSFLGSVSGLRVLGEVHVRQPETADLNLPTNRTAQRDLDSEPARGANAVFVCLGLAKG